MSRAARTEAEGRDQAGRGPHRTGPVGRSQTLALMGLALLATAYYAGWILRNSHRLDDGRRLFVIFDDALITMRYAWNIAHGHGAVWNPGERVEGYTNPLMVLLMVPATLLLDRYTAVLAVQIFGIATLLGVGWACTRLADELIDVRTPAPRALLRCLMFALPLAYFPLYFWTLMGMETGVLTLLVTLSVLTALRATRDCRDAAPTPSRSPGPPGAARRARQSGPDRPPWPDSSPAAAARTQRHTSDAPAPTGTGRGALLWLPHLLALCYLTRPDALVPGALILGYVCLELHRARTPHRMRQTAYCVGVLATYVVAHLLWRRGYYGQWVPNTYILKMTGMSLADRLRNGLGFMSLYFKQSALLLGLAMLGALWRPNLRKLLLLSIPASLIGYQIYVGGDPWPYWRIMTPGAPLLLLLGLTVGLQVAERLRTPQHPSRGTDLRTRSPAVSLTRAGVVVLSGVAPLLPANYMYGDQALLWRQAFTVESARKAGQAAAALDEILSPQATVGVLWAGAIPYYTARRAVDFLGKCDPEIARLPPRMDGKVAWDGMFSVPGHNKFDLNISIIRRQPDYLQEIRWGGQTAERFVSTRYVSVRYRTVDLWLKRDSPNVDWSRLAGAGQAP